jgi:diacylglycerol kinase family enzyme
LHQPRAEALRGKTVAIVNPKSGRKDGEIPEALRAFLEAQGRGGEVWMPGEGRSIADLAQAAVDEGCALVIAAGGDGTICGVGEVLAGTDTALGVIPAGTFNYFARSLELPQDVEGALEVIAAGHTRPVNVGRINDRMFLNNASVGIYSLIRRVRERTYRHWGRSRAAAYWSVLRALMTLYNPMDVTLTVDGETRRARTSLVFVCISPFQLELFELEGAEAARNGQLALFLSRDRGRFGLLKQALRLATHGMQRGRDFDLITGREVTVETGRPFRHVVRDGETERMKGPFRFEMVPGALKVVVPAGTAA